MGESTSEQYPTYVVTDEQRELWQIEVELLEKFKQICKKYGMQYYASSGTLLGAVRHKGFIPWDDDIDLFLKWKDYKKFIKVAPCECQYPYFFQDHHTETEGEASACRIRRSDTTGCTKWEAENITNPEYNRGVFIDIFPLFELPNSLFGRHFQKKMVMFWWKCIRGHDALREIQNGKISKYEVYIKYFRFARLLFDITTIKDHYLSACAFHGIHVKATAELGATSSRIHQPNLIWNAKAYRETIELPFENTTISCPIEYEEVLSKQYGAWQVPVMNGARHEMTVLDIKHPYTDYFANSSK